MTGGSRGIGKAIAGVLAAEGVDVVIAARGQAALERTAAELTAFTGRRIVPIVADTGRKDSVDALVESAVRTLGGVDILVLVVIAHRLLPDLFFFLRGGRGGADVVGQPQAHRQH